MLDIDKRELPVQKILILSANPETTSPLNLKQEMQNINQALKGSKYGSRFEIYSHHGADIHALRLQILNIRPQIVHFMGHGDPEGLYMENKHKMPVKLTADAINRIFKLARHHVDLVFLNSCYSDRLADRLSQYTHHVLGVSDTIRDSISVPFSNGFYHALGTGKSVPDAFECGIIAVLEAFPHLSANGIPITLKTGIPDKEEVTIKFLILSTGEEMDIPVPLDTKTVSLKERLMDKLMLPTHCEDGTPLTYSLRSKTRSLTLEDAKTLGQNNIRENEILVLKVEVENRLHIRLRIGEKTFLFD